MGCSYKAKLNELRSIWYTWIVLGLQAYLIYLGLQRYKLYHDMKWPTGGYPTLWLAVYMGLYLACIPMLVLFFAFGCFKSGNLGGDNEKLAAREDRTLEVTRNSKGEKSGCVHRLKNLWEHAPPMPQQIHVLIALCQLVAQQLMIAQLYRYGFMNSGDVLNTELDFIYQRARQLASNLPQGDTVYQGFRLNTNQLSDFPLSANVLPLLMNVRLFGIPLEFVNLLIALIAYSATYPSVFWRVHKGISLLFSFLLLLCSIAIIYTYLGFTILYRIQETNYNNQRPVGIGQYLGSVYKMIIFHPFTILGLFVGSIVVLILAPITIYSYAYNKYYVSMMNLQAKNRIRSGTTHSEYSSHTNKSYSRADKELCCNGYCPNTVAIILILAFLAVRAIFMFAYFMLLRHDWTPLLVSCVVADGSYIVAYVVVWLILTVKKDWNFRVSHTPQQLYALQKGAVTGHIRGNENPSQLKNALIMLHGDHMFVTEDQAVKQSLLRHTQKSAIDPSENFWSKQNGMEISTSYRRPEEMRENPEVSRLMPRSSVDGSVTSYQQHSQATISRADKGSPQLPMHAGTMQRNPQMSGMSTMQRSMPPGQWSSQTYASIHKQQKPEGIYQSSMDAGIYGQMDKSSTYGTYARVPAQTRVPIPPSHAINTVRINGNNYDMNQSTLPRRSNPPQQMAGVRQSPLFSERHPHAPVNMQTTQINAPREQSPYQTSAIKMSSFNNGQEKPVVYGAVGQPWSRSPPQQLSYTPSKPSSASQQDAYATMSSTVTSQSSSQPTPGSPQTPVFGRDNIYGSIDEDKTLQKPQRQSTGFIRHAVKVVDQRHDDSANFSLSSGQDSARGNGDFATSIV